MLSYLLYPFSRLVHVLPGTESWGTNINATVTPNKLGLISNLPFHTRVSYSPILPNFIMRWLFRNRAPAKPAGSSSADHAAMGRSSPTPTYGPNPISEVEPKTALSVLSDPPKTSDSNQPPPPSILVADPLPGITEGIPHSNAKPPFSGGQKYPRL